MRHTCIIIDDEELARELIASHLAQINSLELVASCASAIEASIILQNQQIDLLFLDIEMPVLKGTDFFKNLVYKPKVIFTTAYRDYALDGFELNAVDYLLKPITFSRFFKAVEKFKNGSAQIKQANSQPATTTNTTIFVTKNRKNIRINLDDIIYIESLKDYVRIYLRQESHTIKFSITAFQTKQLDDRFIRIHRSYIVNSQKITAYTKNDIEIGDIEIPIGDKYKRNLNHLMT